MDIRAYEELGRATIAGRTSMGENVRNDATFDRVKSEINKLNTVSTAAGDSIPQWKIVSEACEIVLKQESKDLLAGSYLTYALLESNGIEGLLAGLSTIQAMLSEHWEDLYPPLTRLAGRAAALNWLHDSLEKYFDRHRDVTYDYVPMSQIKVIVGQIDDFLGQQQSDELSLHHMVQLIESLPVGPSPTPTAQNISSEALESETFSMGALATGPAPQIFPERAKTTAGAPSAPGLDLSSCVVNSNPIAMQVTEAAFSLLMRVSNYRVEQKQWDQVSLYLFKQIALWSKRYQYPKQHQGQTFIAAPDQKWLSSLEKHYQEKAYPELLKEALTLMEGHPYWIDLIFYVVHALETMGEAYRHAIRIMIALTVDWLQAFPMLKHYTFLNGTVPFARQATLDWLDTLTRSGRDVQSSSDDSFLLELDKVDKRTGQDQLQSVIALQHHLKSAVKESHKIALLVKTIEVFVLNREKKFLINVIKQLSDKMAYFHLVEWDRELAKKGLIAIVRAKQLLEESIGQDLEQLAEIDVGMSIQLQKEAEALAQSSVGT